MDASEEKIYYTDGLLYFGNVRTAYRKLRALTQPELDRFFGKQRFDTEKIKAWPDSGGLA